MTERKVLNKYFPPDYDPSKIPRLPRGKRNRVFNLRTMAPFNMRCTTCKTYIYKARKFNSRMEPVDNEDYLGLRIYRFYIRCTACCSEISWKTDIANNDYVLESGAVRIFEATRTAYKMAIQKVEQTAEEEKNNPMKLLENRTKQSKNEMDALETLEDLKDQNLRHANLEVAEEALDALNARSCAKKRNEEAEIEAEAQRLLEIQARKKEEREESATSSLKLLAQMPKKKRKMTNCLQGIKLKKKCVPAADTEQLQTSSEIGRVSEQLQTSSEIELVSEQPQTSSEIERFSDQPQTSSEIGHVSKQPQTSSEIGRVSKQPQTSSEIGRLSEQPKLVHNPLGGLIQYSDSDSNESC